MSIIFIPSGFLLQNYMRFLHFLFAVSILNIPSNVFSQTNSGTIRGFVYEKATGEPIIFTNVYLKGTTHGAATDENGYYSITKIPAGSYVLMVTSMGYDTVREEVTVKAGDILTKKLFLVKGSKELIEIEVSAEREEAKTEIQTSVIKITPKEIKQIPSVGGEPDLAQYLQVLPGVIFTGDQGGQLYIRGGSPIQNKVLLDGMIIYNPFHSIGLFSVFDAELLRNVEVYTGGFSAEYGGRISSIMDLNTRDGNKKRFAGKAAASPFTSKLIFEGPIKRIKEDESGSASFILSAKTSYLQQSSKLFYSYIDTAGLPYNFTDFYGKVSLNSNNGSKLNLFGFKFGDNVKYRSVSDINWESTGFGANFVLVPGASSTLIDGTFAYSIYDITLLEAELDPRSSSIDGFNMGLNFTYFLGKDEAKYGLEVLGYKTNFKFFNAVNRKIEQTEYTTELAGFFKYKKIIGKFLMEPSLRFQYYSSLSEISPEPRLGMKYNISNRVRAKFAGGWYSQNLISATSDRDVVNLFYGFLSGSDNIPEIFNGREVKTKLQKARHAIIGIEYDFLKHFNINVEAYVKDFNQLTNLNRDKLYEDTPDNSGKPDYQKNDFIVETGLAKGLDFLLKYDYKRLYMWAVYSLGFVTRYDGIREYVPHFDRRHNMNLVFSYTFGKNFNWEVDTRWNLGSGFPFTKTQGFFEYLDFQDGLNTDYTKQNGELGLLYADINGGRLPYYHRLDFTIKRRFEIGKNSTLEATVNAINLYNRENIFYVNRITNQRVNQLPILPSAGISMTF